MGIQEACVGRGRSGLGLGQGNTPLQTVGTKQRGRDLPWGAPDRKFFETSCRKLTREQPVVPVPPIKENGGIRLHAYGNQPSTDAGNRKKNTVRR